MYGQPNYYYQPRYVQPQQPVMQQPIQQMEFNKPVGIQGKIVDSLDVAKAMDINLDGSTSYFPLTDGTAIITKQLQMDGTSKTIIYKPVKNEDVKQIKYATLDDISELKEKMAILENQYDELSKKGKKEWK